MLEKSDFKNTILPHPRYILSLIYVDIRKINSFVIEEPKALLRGN